MNIKRVLMYSLKMYLITQFINEKTQCINEKNL